MNTTELDSLVKSTFAEINRLLVVKGGEYANADDRLVNFKRGAALTGCTPLQVLFIYMSKHYDAVASFVQTSAKGEARPSSEPIEGRLDDLINYCLLAKGLIGEMKKSEVKHEDDKIITKGPDKGLTINEARKLQDARIARQNLGPYYGIEAACAVGVTGRVLQVPPDQADISPEHR